MHESLNIQNEHFVGVICKPAEVVKICNIHVEKLAHIAHIKHTPTTIKPTIFADNLAHDVSISRDYSRSMNNLWYKQQTKVIVTVCVL